MSYGKSVIQEAQKALKLVNGVHDEEKMEGLNSLRGILARKEHKLVEYGYNQLILKELIKLLKFESGNVLIETLDVLEINYFMSREHQDALAEAMLYKYGLATDLDVCLICLEKISKLIDLMDENVAKHSKQLLRIADINTDISLNPIIIEILKKVKQKVPERKETTNTDL